MSTKAQYVGPLTNKHLRFMAWGAFLTSIVLAVFGLASDGIIIAFLTSAGSSLGMVQARNMGEDIVAGKANAGGKNVASGVDISKV